MFEGWCKVQEVLLVSPGTFACKFLTNMSWRNDQSNIRFFTSTPYFCKLRALSVLSVDSLRIKCCSHLKFQFQLLI